MQIHCKYTDHIFDTLEISPHLFVSHIFCHYGAAIFLPLQAHFVHSERFVFTPTLLLAGFVFAPLSMSHLKAFHASTQLC